MIGLSSLVSLLETCEPDRILLDDVAWVSERCEASALAEDDPLSRPGALVEC